MTGDHLSAGELGLDAFGTACGLAVVAGALSVIAPTFDVLTATLVALALAGWASVHRREAGRPRPLTASFEVYAVPFALLGGAAVVFLDPPGPVVPWRALLLGLGVVPLWTAERLRPGSSGRPRRGP
jgi:hypothetical protein